jgi:hypothetical protein
MAMEHLPDRLVRETERAGKQPRPPAGLRSRLDDALLEIG